MALAAALTTGCGAVDDDELDEDTLENEDVTSAALMTTLALKAEI